MNLYQTFLELTDGQKKIVQIELCHKALSIWNNYCQTNAPVKYVESVVGTKQVIDVRLLSDALKSVQTGYDLHNVEERFSEPVTALQDDDLNLPEQIEYAFYSIYNLYGKYVLEKNIDDWLIVNQAISAEANEDVWKNLLENAIEKSK